jgi:methanogenic corrinoid protein MtbC1
MGKVLEKSFWGSAPEAFPSEQRLKLTPDRPPLESDGRADLLATIHEKIIPQLVLAHRAELVREASCPDSRPPPTVQEVAAFAVIAVQDDLPAALAFIEVLASQGIALEAVLLHLVAPAARLLGEQWLDDLRSFTEVTIGLGVLQRVVHVLGPSFAPEVGHRGVVVLVAAPNEQHTLGIYLLGEFLRRDGWGVQVQPNMAPDELITLVESQPLEMVGISVSNSHLLAPVSDLIASIKRAPLNADMAVMVGGSCQLRDDAERMGAMFCSDPRDAVRWLDQHVRNRQQHARS